MSNQFRNNIKLEKRRLDRLKKELDRQQKKLNEDKMKLQQQFQDLRIEQNRIQSYKLTENKLKNDLEKAKKEKREIRKLYEEAQSEIKILKRKVKRHNSSLTSYNNDSPHSTSSSPHSYNNGNNNNNHHETSSNQNGKHSRNNQYSFYQHRNNNNERIRRHAKKEVSNMKKRLRLAMNDLDKQARYYETQIKNIKLQKKKEVTQMKMSTLKDKQLLKELKRRKSSYKLPLKDHVSLPQSQRSSCFIYNGNIHSPRSPHKLHQSSSPNNKHNNHHHKRNKLQNHSSLNHTMSSSRSPRTPHSSASHSNVGSPRRLRKEDSRLSQQSGHKSEYYETDDDDSGSHISSETYNINSDEIFQEFVNEFCEQYKDIKRLNYHQLDEIEIIIKGIKLRQNKFIHRLNELSFDINLYEEIQEIVNNYQSQICNVYNNIIINNKQKTFYMNTNKQRLNDIQKAIDVLKNQQPKQLLDEIITILSDKQSQKIENHDQDNHDGFNDDDQQWIDIFKAIRGIYNEKRAHHDLLKSQMNNNNDSNHSRKKKRKNRKNILKSQEIVVTNFDYNSSNDINDNISNHGNHGSYDSICDDLNDLNNYGDIDSNDSCDQNENHSSNSILCISMENIAKDSKTSSIDGLDDIQSLTISPSMNSSSITSIGSVGSVIAGISAHSHLSVNSVHSIHSISHHSNISSITNNISHNISMEILDEMSQRRKDIEAIQMLNDNDMDIPREEIENIRQSTKKRHSLTMNKLLHLIPNDIINNYNNNNNNNNNQNNDDQISLTSPITNNLNLILNKLRIDNFEWQKELEKLSMESEEIKFMKQLNKKYNDELNARIADLLKINELVNNDKKCINKVTIKTEMDNIIQSIADRHQIDNLLALNLTGFDERLESPSPQLQSCQQLQSPELPALNPLIDSYNSASTNNTEKVANFICDLQTNEIAENNQDWRDVVMKIASTVTNNNRVQSSSSTGTNNLNSNGSLLPLNEGDYSSDHDENEADDDQNNDNNDEDEYEYDDNKDNDDNDNGCDNYGEIWWLHKNEQRKKRMEQISFDEQVCIK